MNVYAALETLNHHVKDVTKLSEYLYFCDCAVKSNCKFWIDDPDKHYQVRQLLEKADELDEFAKEHYGVALQAVKNYKFGTVEEVVSEEYKNHTKTEEGMCGDWDEWAEWDAWLNGELKDEVDIEVEVPKVKVVYDDFILPEISISGLDNLRLRVKADKGYIYELKKIVLNYALCEGAAEGIQIRITGCEEKHGQKYVSLIVKTSDGTYKFHCPVEGNSRFQKELLDKKIKSFVDFEIKVWNLPSEKVAAALKVVEHFVAIHHLTSSKEDPDEKDS